MRSNTSSVGRFLSHPKNSYALRPPCFDVLGRIPALRGLRDPEEKLAKVQQLINDGMLLAKERMNTTGAVVDRFEHSMKSATKQFGQFVAEGVKPVLQFATALIR